MQKWRSFVGFVDDDKGALFYNDLINKGAAITWPRIGYLKVVLTSSTPKADSPSAIDKAYKRWVLWQDKVQEVRVETSTCFR
jgi:hypothetical protein